MLCRQVQVWGGQLWLISLCGEGGGNAIEGLWVAHLYIRGAQEGSSQRRGSWCWQVAQRASMGYQLQVWEHGSVVRRVPR